MCCHRVRTRWGFIKVNSVPLEKEHKDQRKRDLEGHGALSKRFEVPARQEDIASGLKRS